MRLVSAAGSSCSCISDLYSAAVTAVLNICHLLRSGLSFTGDCAWRQQALVTELHVCTLSWADQGVSEAVFAVFAVSPMCVWQAV
jgi:hypothetical protein